MSETEQNSIQKVAVIGMGALGLLYADQITQTMGMSAVTFIMDQNRLKKYAVKEFTVNGQIRHFQMGDCSQATPYDLVIVAVKYNGLESALETMSRCVGPDTVILSVLNGISSEKIIGARFGQEHVVDTVAQGMDAMHEGDSLKYTQKGELHLGVADGPCAEQQKENLKRVIEFFDRANVPYIVEKDITYRMWCKFMLNVGINQVCHAYETDYAGAMQEGSEAAKILKEAMEEVVTLAQAEHVALTEADLENDMAIICSLCPTSYPSMRQDGVAKRPSEVEMFAGTVIRMAKEHGIKVPANEYLYEKIKKLESTYHHMRIARIQKDNDKELAELIRYNLKANGLDIPGTVYFDPELDHLSSYYLDNPKADYYVVLNDENKVIGGVGLNIFTGFDHCAELQKLYLDDSVKGHGYGYKLIDFIMEKAKEMGYTQMYLETHHNLATAIHIYEKRGFKRIEKLPQCVHNTMDTFFLIQL